MQPSHHRAQFSVGDCITDHRYYRLAYLNESQCAQYVANAGLIRTYEVSGTSSVTSSGESSTRLSSVTQQDEKESDKPIIYVAGSLSALIIIVFGTLIIVLSILYLCKFRNRETSKYELTINTSLLAVIFIIYFYCL